MKFGIDISRHNGNFDLARAKSEGVEFVVLKGGGGDAGLYKDAKFETHYSTCKKLGLPVGAYFYSRALTITRAKEEAQFFYDYCLRGKQFELPVYIDVEEQAQFKLGKTALTNIVNAFCETLENKGFFVGIYSTSYAFSTYMDDSKLKRYTHWVAGWLSSCPYQDKSVLGMWQFGGETNKLRSVKVAGVTCDQNYMYVDFPFVIRNAGLNGFPKPVKYEYTPADARLALRMSVGLEKITAEALKLYDLDGDGKITSADARAILRKAVGNENAKIIEAGDVDMDGDVDEADARLALRAAVKLEELITEQTEAADVDGDGKITEADARIIMRKAVGLE